MTGWLLTGHGKAPMFSKLFILFYIVFIAPVLAITMAGLAYGGVMEFIKWYNKPVSVEVKQ
jgi:hypothetical protein